MWNRSRPTRVILERIEKPDVDEITGIAPAIAIRQKNSHAQPALDGGDATEIYDYLRLLYARAGKTYCTRCGPRGTARHHDDRGARGCAAAGARFLLLYKLQLPARRLARVRRAPRPMERQSARR